MTAHGGSNERGGRGDGVRAGRAPARPHPRAVVGQPGDQSINPETHRRGRRLRRCTPRAARPACRCSSSAPARTGATAPTSRGSTTPSRRRTRSAASWPPSSASSTRARPIPRLILVSTLPDDRALLAEAFTPEGRPQGRDRPAAARREARAGRPRADQRPRGAGPQDGGKLGPGEDCSPASARAFGLEAQPERIEVYDNSHIMGTNAVGGMIVAGPEGFQKNQYRKFNIKSTELTPGDDYGMMTRGAAPPLRPAGQGGGGRREPAAARPGADRRRRRPAGGGAAR